jgi:hypothetical protein
VDAKEFHAVSRRVEGLTRRLCGTEVERDAWKRSYLAIVEHTVTKAERDAQSVLIDEQRRLLAEKQTEIGALEAERDDLRKIVEMVHADLGIQRGDHVGEAISELKKEASDATARQRMTEVRALKYSAQAEDARREIRVSFRFDEVIHKKQKFFLTKLFL